MKNQADLSSESCLWYTPSEIIESAWYVMGSIDFDPASDAIANQTVGATEFLTEQDDALNPNTRWLKGCNIWLNPPSTNLKKKVNGTRSLASAFWRKLHQEYLDGNVKSAIYLCVSSKLLHLNPSMLKYPICFTTSDATSDCISGQGRIRFVNGVTGEMQKAPTQTNAFVLLPNCEGQKLKFRREFSKFGKVINV